MPDRFVRETLLTSRWAHLSVAAQLLYIRLLLKVCDYGIYEADPKLLAAVCYPIGYRAWPKPIARLLDELAAADLIELYRVNGKSYLRIKRWKERARSENAKFPFPNGRFEADIPLSQRSRAHSKQKRENHSGNGEESSESETFCSGEPIKSGVSESTLEASPMPYAYALEPKPKPPAPAPSTKWGGGGACKKGIF